MTTPELHADLSVTRGADRLKVRASGSRVVVSLRNPLAALRLRRSFGRSIEDFTRRLGLTLEVKCLGIPLARYRPGER